LTETVNIAVPDDEPAQSGKVWHREWDGRLPAATRIRRAEPGGTETGVPGGTV